MKKRTGLVLAGAAARGAYEAGALSVLLPVLEERGERPTVLIGTSAGALNAAFLASRAHLAADVAAKELVDLWEHTDRDDLFHIVSSRLPTAIAQELGWTNRPGSLVDTEPLRATLDSAIGDWAQIRANLDDGHLDALGVVTTSTSTGRTVIFLVGGTERHRSGWRLPKRDNKKGIDYVAPETGIGVEHVMASAAIPMLFPPIEIPTSDETSEWFVDGGLRLNTPIKPAIELGVDQVAIVAADPATHIRGAKPITGTPPDFADHVLHYLQSSLADPLIEDLWTLARMNTLISAKGVDDMRRIGYLFVGPYRQGAFGKLVDEVLEKAEPGFFKPLTWLDRLVGNELSQHHELLSYLLFTPEFFKEAVDQGKHDAKRELKALEKLGADWRFEPFA